MQQLINDLVEAWNSHDLERIVAFYAPDYEGFDVGQAKPQRGLEGVRQMVTGYWHAFPDLQFTGEEMLADGDRAALAWMARGTHQGHLMNMPPTGQRIEVRGISLLTVDGQRIIRGVYLWDVAGLLRTLGLLPDL